MVYPTEIEHLFGENEKSKEKNLVSLSNTFTLKLKQNSYFIILPNAHKGIGSTSK